MGTGRLRRELISPRAYQEEIARSVLGSGSTLVVLPTGLGKTLIALLLIERKFAEGRILFLAPTKPLCEQHYREILAKLDVSEEEIALLTGEVPPGKRKALWERRICVATPQTARNDLQKGLLTLSPAPSPEAGVHQGIVLCIFDEAHRAVGNYAYTFLAEECKGNGVLVLGLTASPGGSRKKIEAIVEALGVQNVEARTHGDDDVREYVQPLEITWVEVELSPKLRQAAELLRGEVQRYAQALTRLGFPGRFYSKKELLSLRGRIMALPGSKKFIALSYYTTLFNLVHLHELLETQGTTSFRRYLQDLGTRTSQGAKRITGNPIIRQVERLLGSDEHPKLAKLLQLVQARPNKQLIVFVQYRDQIDLVVRTLQEAGITAERFVGKRKGVTRKEQEDTIARFRQHGFQAMVASSIGEEGLDIPSVDTVIFYEPVPSAIRTIQRKGRAGRTRIGEVLMLITQDTRDEAIHWLSFHQERRMQKIVKSMKEGKGLAGKGMGLVKEGNRLEGNRLGPMKEGKGIGATAFRPAKKEEKQPRKKPVMRVISAPEKKGAKGKKQSSLSDFL